MPISNKDFIKNNKKRFCYALLLTTTIGIAGCSWTGKVWDATFGQIFFKPNKWQDEIDLGPRRSPAENPGNPRSGMAREVALERFKKVQSSGNAAYPYPDQNSGAAAPAGGNMGYPSPTGGFQPQGMGSSSGSMQMPQMSDDPAQDNGMNPFDQPRRYIRQFEPMANDFYMDGTMVIAKNEKINEAELPVITPVAKPKKQHSKNMFPLQDYAPKPDAPVVKTSGSFPKLQDVPKNPESPAKDKFDSEVKSLVEELNKANNKRDSLYGNEKPANSDKKEEDPKKKIEGESKSKQDSDSAALGIKPAKEEDADAAALSSLAPASKKDEKAVDFENKRRVLGNITAIESEKKRPKMVLEDEPSKPAPASVQSNVNFIPPAHANENSEKMGADSTPLLLNSRYTDRRR